MKYEVLFSCGHMETITLFGPNKERERQISYYEQYGECSVCKAERLQREKREVIEKSKANELPLLLGSDKQIVWAAKIRDEFIGWLDETIAKCVQQLGTLPVKKRLAVENALQDAYQAKDQILSDRNSAHWWIENKSQRDFQRAIAKTVQMIHDKTICKVEPPDPLAVVTPKQQTHNGIVEIKISNNMISVQHTRDDDFYSVIHSLHYRWDAETRSYIRKVTSYSGPVQDRVAELGNALLHAGFSVRINDSEMRRKAVEADFQQEQRRWIKLCSSGKLIISWDREDNLYSQIKKIYGAKWSSAHQAVVVPLDSYNEVLDLADLLSFSISSDAREAINNYSSLIFSPVSPNTPPETQQPDKLSQILETSMDVLDDLKD